MKKFASLFESIDRSLMNLEEQLHAGSLINFIPIDNDSAIGYQQYMLPAILFISGSGLLFIYMYIV